MDPRRRDRLDRGPSLRGATRRRLLRRFAGLPLVAGVPLALAGCAPEFDWREARTVGDEVRLLLPARPAAASRRIHLRDVPVEMAMVGAEAGGLAFTAAIARPVPDGAGRPVPTGDPVALADAMREQMLRNIEAADTPHRHVSIPVVDAGDRRLPAAEAPQVLALEVRAAGTGRHAGVRLVGRFFVVHGQPAQVVAVGRRADDDAIERFFESLRIVRR